MRYFKKIGMLIAFFCVCLTANSDLWGPYTQTNVPTCPSDMAQFVVYAYDGKVVTIRLKALDGSNAEYTIKTRYGNTQPPYAYFITKGQYRIIEITEGYTASSSIGMLSAGMTIDISSNSGYITFNVQ